jgi:hypothetical protein
MAPQKAPKPKPNFCHHVSGNLACVRRKSAEQSTMAASMSKL